MVPIVLGVIVLVVLLLMLRAYLDANPHDLAVAFRWGGIVLLGLLALGLLFLRRPSLALIAGTVTVAAYVLLRARGAGWFAPKPRPARRASRTGMSRKEALEVLGLAEGSTAEDIRAAHHRLMQQTHPDHGGTDYLAAKINEARDVLLGA
jgi:hypothetical protein